SLREMQQMWRPAGATVTRGAAGAIQLNAGGYAFGLRVSQTCNFKYIVSHTGGLPGFGSIMQWLPEYGAGVIAFGNVTYTAWGRGNVQVAITLAPTMPPKVQLMGIRPAMPVTMENCQ